MRTTYRRNSPSSFPCRALVAALATALAPGALAATFTVSTASDFGTGSLREAMTLAQAACTGAPHTIDFTIPGTGPFVITLTPTNGQLPQLTCSVHIDGTTQSGWLANTDPNGFNATLPIVIDGSSLVGTGACGVRMMGGGTLRGVHVRNFDDVNLLGAGVCGNMTVLGSISEHNDTGIRAQPNAVIGNNATATADRNLMHSNARAGILVSYGGTVVIQNNHIVNNPGKGVDLECSNNIQIRDKNTISGNAGDGIRVNSQNVLIADNNIDGNGANGIVIGATGCGDSTAIQVLDNRITGNTTNGVRLNAGNHRAFVESNTIYSNGLKNINLDFDGGVLPNDTGDTDNGPNARQNYPVPTAATTSAGTTTVTFTLDTTPGSYSLQAWGNSSDLSKPAAEIDMTPASASTFNVTGGPITSSITFLGTFNNISMLANNLANNQTSELSPQIASTATVAACVVTTAADSGIGLLRDAINKANASLCTSNLITFNIPSPPFIVVPATPLPAITANVTIDGTTQTPQPGIDGATVSATNTGCSGLNFNAAGVVKGLIVRNFNNNSNGSGLCGHVSVMASNITSNNYGIDADGGTIGGATAADGNVIASNQKGIFISTFATVNVMHNSVNGNVFGLYTDCATGGGTVENNDFSGNSSDGLWLKDAVGFQIRNNTINSNGRDGVYIGLSCTGSRNNTFDGNTITGNAQNGIVLRSDASNGNEIAVNSIHGNGAKNIDLNFPGGPLPNDDGDPDVGPNRLQNYPLITSLGFVDGSIIVNFQLRSAPSSTFKVRAFANDSAAKPSGKTFAGEANVTTDGAGVANGSINAGAPPRDHFSLTATETTTKDTSEFSPIFSIPTSLPTPLVSVTGGIMNFGGVTVGTTSPPQTANLFSGGTAPYRINSIRSDPNCTSSGPMPMCASGGFQCSTTCEPGSDYPPATAAACSVTGQFNPQAAGPATTTIYICDNTASSPQQIILSGNGIQAPPPPPPAATLEIAPASFDFGRVLIGQGVETTFLIINHAQVTVSIGAPQVNGTDFALLSTTCGPSLPPVSACSARVGFIPSQSSTMSGTLEVGGGVATALRRSKVENAPARADLIGTGFSAASISLPATVDFGTFMIGSPTPVRRTVTVTNTGSAVLTFSTVSVAGPFTLTNNCPLNLAVGASCELVLDFTTTTVGEFTGVLNVVSNAEGSRAIALTARSQLRPEPIIVVAPVSIGFGNQAIGSTSNSQRITIRNDGGVAASLGALNVSAEFVIVSEDCGATLEPGASCSAQVAMLPQAFGQRSGQFLVNSNAPGSPHAVNMVGTGCRPFFFGGNRVGTNIQCAP